MGLLSVIGLLRSTDDAKALFHFVRAQPRIAGYQNDNERRIRRRDVEARGIVRERVAHAEDARDLGGVELVKEATAHGATVGPP
jgi:hypothetical protein